MTKPSLESLIWDEYHERFFTPLEVDRMYLKYKKWHTRNNIEPEIPDRIHINEENIGHVVYHAYIEIGWEANHAN